MEIPSVSNCESRSDSPRFLIALRGFPGYCTCPLGKIIDATVALGARVFRSEISCAIHYINSGPNLLPDFLTPPRGISRPPPNPGAGLRPLHPQKTAFQRSGMIPWGVTPRDRGLGTPVKAVHNVLWCQVGTANETQFASPF
jgi:hypothetical protein